tara:strand:- start:340 stop:834 length:495 start_codon:yes stop_codon:yes gene_type:complete
MGPAGVTLVVIKENILNKVSRNIPTMLNYRSYINSGSMTNTPPVFSVYTTLLNLRWIESQGGIEELEKRNIKKAELLYNEIDRNIFFKGYAAKEDRSSMNVTFELTNENLSNNFNQIWENNNISGLKGHRSVGGYRASIYNALPIESVKVLVDCMQKFEKQNKK